MDRAAIVTTVLSNILGNERGSYYRVAGFSVVSLLKEDDSLRVDAYIEMSCGNDVMNGGFGIPGSLHGAPVPEPSTIALIRVGRAGFVCGTARRRMKKKKT